MADRDYDGWAWFMQPQSPEELEEDATRVAFARTFSSAAGRQVLAHLRAKTIERQLPPEASVPSLRFLEGQRQLVHTIERLAGLNGPEGESHG